MWKRLSLRLAHFILPATAPAMMEDVMMANMSWNMEKVWSVIDGAPE